MRNPPLHVYVAGSSDELDRAIAAMARLRDAGIVVTSTWPENIAAVGHANPRDAAKADRALWAATCLRQVESAAVLWLLAPAVGHGRGAYVELGYALAMGLGLIASGDTAQSIFGAAALEFESDDEAAAHLCALARNRG